MKYLNLTGLLLVAAITGCSEGGIGGTGGTAVPPLPDGSDNSLLVQAGDARQYNDYVTGALEAWGGLSEDPGAIDIALSSPFPESDSDLLTSVEDAAPAFANASGDTTTRTNLIVSGVDEADTVKYDGEHLFLANGEYITVMEARESGEPRTLANLKLDAAAREFTPYTQGLYLDEDNRQLVSLAGQGFYGGPVLLAADTSILPYPQVTETLVRFVDVSQPEAPANTTAMAIEGNLLESRRIGNRLYLVTQYSPEIKGYQPFAADEKSQAENRKIIDTTDFSTLVPSVTVGGVTTDLFSAADCLIPNPERDPGNLGYPVLTGIVTIDLAARSVAEATCIADDVWGLHMTDTSLYVASHGQSAESYYGETTFHRFDLAAGPEYVASGKVAGSFWGNPAFLMGERDGRLAVLTTREGNGETRFTHHLSVLALNAAGDELEVVGSLPNDSRPDPIGKPNEQIFASRFIGDRAYVVTFEQIDPVYAIDLSEPTDPRILGELEIPGFSSYLHPVGDDFLIGIGMNTRTTDNRVVNDGVNVRLFDVRDPSNVALLQEYVLGQRWSYTPVAFDYRAFTYQVLADGSARFALPVHRYGAHLDELADDVASPWTDTALHLFEVQVAGTPSLSRVGQLTSEDHSTGQRYQPGCCSWQERSFMNGDTIYFLSRSRLFRDDWTSPGVGVSNAFIDTQFPDPDAEVCAAYVTEPFSGSLIDSQTGNYVACAVTRDSSDFAPGCEAAALTVDPAVNGPGSYTVSAAFPGYTTRTVTDVRVTEGTCRLGTTHLNLYLDPLPPNP